MAVGVIHTEWSGGPSSPCLTTFCVESDGVGDLNLALARVQAFWTNIASTITGSYTLTVNQTIELFDEATGQLIGEHFSGEPPWTTGTGGGQSYARGVGARIDWRTATIRNGRRVKGRTYLVPLASAAYENDGTIITITRDGIVAAGQALIDGLQTDGVPLVVWSRPSTEWPVGALSEVVQAECPDMVAVLRGRRA